MYTMLLTWTEIHVMSSPQWSLDQHNAQFSCRSRLFPAFDHSAAPYREITTQVRIVVDDRFASPCKSAPFCLTLGVLALV